MLVVEDFEILARTIGTGLRREGMAVDVVLRRRRRARAPGGDPVRRRGARPRPARAYTATRCAGGSSAGHSGSRVLMLTAASTVTRAGGRPGPRRRRLPAQAVRLRRTGRPRPRSGPPLGRRRCRRSSRPATSPSTRAAGWRPGPGGGWTSARRSSPSWSACSPRAGRLVSAEELLERVWDEAADPFTTAVKTTIRRLRAKLGDPPVIHTVREGGYRIGEP